MNAITKEFAATLTSAKATCERITGELRQQNEDHFRAVLRDYLIGPSQNRSKYVYGGPVNLATEIANACADIAEETGAADWLTAADLFRALEEPLDMHYRPSEPTLFDALNDKADRVRGAER